MVRYAIYLEDPERPDYNGRRLSEREILEVESHIHECEPCRNELRVARFEFQNISSFVEEAGFGDLTTHPKEVAKVSRASGRKIRWSPIFAVPKIRIAIAFGFALLVMSSVFYLQANRHPYIEWAAVNVARSTTAFGLYFLAYVKASAKIRRPSASVFTTSIVVPELAVKISPGFIEVPLGKFSVAGMSPTT